MQEGLGPVPFAGFESYGDIALRAGDFSGFRNTTSVVPGIVGITARFAKARLHLSKRPQLLEK